MSASGAGGSSTLGTVDTTTTTTETTYNGGGMDPNMTMTDSATLPNTGGEPLIISMLGTLMAGSGLVLRRKFN
jgi:LPXTG-motif cell wall-anchored protein